MSETVMDVLGEFNLPYYAESHGLTKMARELAAARAQVEAMKEERDEHKAKWEAIYDIRAFPRPEEVLQLLTRLPRRDAEVIDRAFAEGATLLAAAEFEHRRLKREHEQLAADLAVMRKALDGITDHGWYYDGRVTFTINCVSRDDAIALSNALGCALAAQEGNGG